MVNKQVCKKCGDIKEGRPYKFYYGIRYNIGKTQSTYYTYNAIYETPIEEKVLGSEEGFICNDCFKNHIHKDWKIPLYILLVSLLNFGVFYFYLQYKDLFISPSPTFFSLETIYFVGTHFIPIGSFFFFIIGYWMTKSGKYIEDRDNSFIDSFAVELHAKELIKRYKHWLKENKNVNGKLVRWGRAEYDFRFKR